MLRGCAAMGDLWILGVGRRMLGLVALLQCIYAGRTCNWSSAEYRLVQGREGDDTGVL